ncbi:MAG: hypothetical protein FJW35_08920 [Acidobacteria bacterium]|nr:hypothetical protein [Acidobacteriota bacterium]
MRRRSIRLWLSALGMVLAAALYQRLSGPTYPIRGKVVAGETEVRFRLIRTFDGAGDAEIRLPVENKSVAGQMTWRRTPSRDEWQSTPLEREGDALVARIPHQPPAGKVMYRIFLDAGTGPIPLTADPVTIRFKGPVPLSVLIPHVIAMFLAMLFSTRAGLEALIRGPNAGRLALWTLITLVIGGLILGPVVQKLAFGAFWTGWPFGTDLTDNKTLVAAVCWLAALWRLRRNPQSRGWPLAASVVLMLVYLIPHSLLGSELDYTQLEGGAEG